MIRHAAALLLALTVCASAGAGGADDALYADYDALLRKHVDDQGRVDYGGLGAEREALTQVLDDLRAVDPAALTGKQRLAFWINVYNAVTLDAIVSHLPLESIKELAPAKDGFHVWESPTFQGKSLNQIEHEVLRPLGDPRIHAAIVCASIGCPPLRNEAYLPSRLDAQLDANVRAWLASPERGLRITGKVAHLSAIFEWFGADFGADQAARLAWVGRYVDEATRGRLAQVERVQSLGWDWSLNRRP